MAATKKCDHCGKEIPQHEYAGIIYYFGINGRFCLDCYGIIINSEARPQEFTELVATAILDGRYDE